MIKKQKKYIIVYKIYKTTYVFGIDENDDKIIKYISKNSKKYVNLEEGGMECEDLNEINFINFLIRNDYEVIGSSIVKGIGPAGVRTEMVQYEYLKPEL